MSDGLLSHPSRTSQHTWFPRPPASRIPSPSASAGGLLLCTHGPTGGLSRMSSERSPTSSSTLIKGQRQRTHSHGASGNRAAAAEAAAESSCCSSLPKRERSAVCFACLHLEDSHTLTHSLTHSLTHTRRHTRDHGGRFPLLAAGRVTQPSVGW